MLLPIILAAAQLLPPAFDDWKYLRSIDAHQTRGPVSITVPASLYANAQPSLADVSIVRDGKNVPFAVVTPPPSNVTWKTARLQDTGYVSGRYSQAVGDFGVHDMPIDVIEVGTTATSFSVRASVDASDDGHTWRIVTSRAPLYDYARDGLATNLQIRIPPTTSRYMRVRIASPAPFPIDALQGAEGSSAPRQLERYPVATTATAQPQHRVVYDLHGIAEVPIERLDITASTARYARSIEIENNSGDGWRTVASGSIERTPKRSSASFTFDESQAPHWRLVIDNGDNDPLDGVRVYAFGASRRIVFDANSTPAFLVYGDPNAAEPVYDYAQTHASALSAATGAALGPTLRNPSFVPQSAHAPWTERHRWILWAALALMAAAVGLVSLRALRNDVSSA